MAKTKPKSTVKPIVKKSLARSYVAPLLEEVGIELTYEEVDFKPVPNGLYSDVCVLVPELNHLNQQQVLLNHRTVHEFYCGFSVKMPAGFRLRAEIKPYWAGRGLVLSSGYLDENNRFKLIVVNTGQESPLIIAHKAEIARIWVEPAYSINWS